MGPFKICVFKLIFTLALAYIITIYDLTVYFSLVYGTKFVFYNMKPKYSFTEWTRLYW